MFYNEHPIIGGTLASASDVSSGTADRLNSGGLKQTQDLSAVEP